MRGVVFAVAATLAGCAFPRDWGHKRVLCRPTEQVTAKEYLDEPGVEWRRVKRDGMDLLCAVRRLGTGGLGEGL